MTTQPYQAQTDDPFAGGESRASVSFKDKPVGTSYTLKVTEAPSMVQARDYQSGQPAYWPDGNPKMTVVTGVVDTTTGEELNLWAAKPSALFRAIGDAQKQAGAKIAAGGTLTVTFSGEKPNENPKMNAQKLYTVTYQAPDAFSDQAQATATPAQAPSPQPATQQAPATAAPTYTPEQIAAAQAAGISLPGLT